MKYISRILNKITNTPTYVSISIWCNSVFSFVKYKLSIQFSRFFAKVLRALSIQIDKYEITNKISKTKFIPLTPIENADNNDIYNEALMTALNAKSVTNIAITGNYGSGKSSLIKSFLKKYPNYKYAIISLANFGTKVETEVLEQSILQQLFYRESSQSIPDSRFKRITNYSTLLLTFYAFLMLLYFVLIGFVFKLKFIISAIPCFFFNSDFWLKYCHYFEDYSYILLIIATSYLIGKLYRILSASKFVKVNFQNVEFEVSDKSTSTIMNNHIDELVYLFEVKKYKMLIFEDIDRYDNTDIFTKLRDLNLLINSSEQISQKVVFLYAVKDDLFMDSKSRVKFFDFIIPVLPYINPSNSGDILSKQFNTLNESDRISQEFIDDISIYINDMRMLTNIFNEYYVYRNVLEKQLIPEKLFSIIIYKNIVPKDFSLLLQEKGELYELLNNSKNKLIESEISDIDYLIDKIRKKLNSINTESQISETELRKEYIYELFKIQPNSVFLIIDSKEYTYYQLIENENFEQIVNSNQKLKFKYIESYGSLSTYESKKDWIEFEKQVSSSDLTYKQRLELVNSKKDSTISDINNEISELEEKKSKLKLQKFKEFSRDKIRAIIEVKENNKLLEFLISRGYIDENYYDYISYFHIHNLTRNDYNFIQNVKNGISPNYTYELNHFDTICKKLGNVDFKTNSILNINLLDYLAINNDSKLKLFLNTMISEFTNPNPYEEYNKIDFIETYATNGKNVNLIFNFLNKHYPTIWDYIENEDFSSFSSIKSRNLILKLILSNFEYNFNEDEGKYVLDFSSLKKVRTNSFFNSIQETNNILELVEDTEYFRDLLINLNVPFRNIEKPEINPNMFKFIIENELFEINNHNIETILKFYNTSIENINAKPLTSILETKNQKLIEYIDKNINGFIDNMEFQIDYNEDYSIFIRVLNNPKLNEKSTEIFCNISKLKINDLSEINDCLYPEKVIITNSLVANWKNIGLYFNNYYGALTIELIEFLNNIENAKNISLSKFSDSKVEDKFNQKLFDSIVYSEDINIKSYEILLVSINYRMNSFDFKELSQEKVILLAMSNIIDLNTNTYTYLKENHPNNHLEFLIKKYNSYNQIEDYDIDVTDFKYLLNINNNNYYLLEDLVEKYASSYIPNNQLLANSVSKKISTLGELKINLDVVNYLITNSTEFNVCIDYILQYHNKMNRVELTEAFSKITFTPYSYFKEEGKRFSIPNNSQNTKLVKILEERNYITKPKLIDSLYSVYVKKWN
jgi:hypothetical protein